MIRTLPAEARFAGPVSLPDGQERHGQGHVSGFGFARRDTGANDGTEAWVLPLASATLPAADHLTTVQRSETP